MDLCFATYEMWLAERRAEEAKQKRSVRQDSYATFSVSRRLDCEETKHLSTDSGINEGLQG